MKQLVTVIVGTRFRGLSAIDTLIRLEIGAELDLVREDNPHDPQAVACYSGGTHLGYVPMMTRGPVAVALDRGEKLRARLIRRAECHQGGRFLTREPMIEITSV
jgi:hypothetical protein